MNPESIHHSILCLLAVDNGALLKDGISKSWSGLGPKGFKPSQGALPLSLVHKEEKSQEVQHFLTMVQRSGVLPPYESRGQSTFNEYVRSLWRAPTPDGRLRDAKLKLSQLGINGPQFFLADKIDQVMKNKRADFDSWLKDHYGGSTELKVSEIRTFGNTGPLLKIKLLA